jgi:hypothetical protein
VPTASLVLPVPLLERDAVGHALASRCNTFAGRVVYYVKGNHGQSAFTCFGGTRGHRYEVSTWDDHVFSPTTELRLVGLMRLARS